MCFINILWEIRTAKDGSRPTVYKLQQETAIKYGIWIISPQTLKLEHMMPNYAFIFTKIPFYTPFTTPNYQDFRQTD